MTFWRTSNHRRGILSICLEKVHFVRTFTFLKKCEYCSLFALFSTSANEQFVLIRVRVRTFLFTLSRTNGNPRANALARQAWGPSVVARQARGPSPAAWGPSSATRQARGLSAATRQAILSCFTF